MEIKSGVNKTRQIIKFICGILGKEYFSLVRKSTKEYESLVKSTLICGTKTWIEREHLRSKIEATKMDAVRRAARTAKLERVRNEDVKEGMG